MSWQATLLEPVVMAALLSGRSAWVAHKLGSAPGILVMLSACLGFVAALFLLAGGYIWLESLYGVLPAVLIMGSAAASFSALSFLASRLIVREKRKRAAAYQNDFVQKMENMVMDAMSELEEPVRNYPKTAVTLAALAGYMAGDKLQDGAASFAQAFDRIKPHLH